MFPIKVPVKTTMKGHAVIHDLIVSHWSTGPCRTLPCSLPVVPCQQTVSAMTPSQLKRFFTWISSITLMSQRQPKQHRPTVSSSYRAKIIVTAIDINTFPSVAPPTSFIRVFIFFLELPASLCKGCLCLRSSDRTAQLSVKC